MPDIDVVDAGRAQLLGAADVVVIVGVAAVDEDVAGCEQRPQLRNDAVDDAAGTMIHTARGGVRARNELRERVGADGAIRRDRLHGIARIYRRRRIRGRP